MPTADELLPQVLEENVIPAGASNIVARTDLVRSVGRFDAALFQLSDWDFWIRLAAAGRAAACNEVLVAVRRHAGNQYLTDDLSRLDGEFEYLRAKHAATAARFGVETDRKRFAHWLASGYRFRRERLRAARVYMRAAFSTRSPGLALLAVLVVLGEWATGSAPAQTPKAISGADWLSAHHP